MVEKTQKGNDLQRGERLQVMLEDAELRALDDFRFENRMPSRAAAVRELLRRGLASTGHQLDRRNSGSSEFGVLNSPDGMSDGASAGD